MTTVVRNSISVGRSVFTSMMSDVTGPPAVVSRAGIRFEACAAAFHEGIVPVEFQTSNCQQTTVNKLEVAVAVDDSANQNLSKKALKRVSMKVYILTGV
jgi:hypothetical protein